MNDTVEYSLNEITDLVTDGKHGDCENEQNSGYYFLSSRDLYNGKLNYNNAREITYDDFANTHQRTGLKPGDILLANTGASIGKMGIAQNDPRVYRTTFQKSISIIKATKKIVDNLFLYYYFLSKASYIKELGYGTAQPNLLISDLKRFIVKIPKIVNQKKIASILSSYDCQIENNTRRIAILVEMAKHIYKEWFVHFRYPGHENDELVESELGMIPEGWEVKELGDVLKSLESGSRPKGGIDPTETEMPSIGAENVLGLGKFDYSKEKYISREFFESMRKGHIESGDVLLYKDGAKLGRKSMFMCGFPHDECCINEHVFILRTNELFSQAYLYFWLDLPNVTMDIINLNSNAAQPGINQKGVKSLSILIADEDTRERFDENVYPILSELFCLAKKNNTLRQTRDLLLPKLISGQVDVSELEIDIGAEA